MLTENKNCQDNIKDSLNKMKSDIEKSTTKNANLKLISPLLQELEDLLSLPGTQESVNEDQKSVPPLDKTSLIRSVICEATMSGQK